MKPEEIPTKAGRWRFWQGLCARCGKARLFREVFCLACWLEATKCLAVSES